MNTNMNIKYESLSSEDLNNVNSKKDFWLKKTFSITYTLLLTTAIITFIEAIRTPNSKIRHILNLETCISFVASYFYSIFMNQINEQSIDWNNITQTRYIDWAITTPMMLLALCLVLSMNSNTIIHIKIIGFIVILNYLMLLFGYLGEIQQLGKFSSLIYGFIAFLLMYLIIFINFVKPKYSISNYILFGIYFIVWSLYGVIYLLDDEYKNMATNILDLIAKCIIGLGLWIYYTNIIYW
jgi:bacteriorhodopsin